MSTPEKPVPQAIPKSREGVWPPETVAALAQSLLEAEDEAILKSLLEAEPSE